MTCLPEVHVGDIGTEYRVRIMDSGINFDPSLASITRLIFSLPGGIVLTKDAIVLTNGSPATIWYLSYTVLAGAGAGSPPAEFHATAGRVKVQAYLEWADGTTFHSDVQTTDDEGRELRIFANLA